MWRASATHRGHECLDQLGRVRDEVLKVLVNLEDGHDRILAHIAVSVFLSPRRCQRRGSSRGRERDEPGRLGRWARAARAVRARGSFGGSGGSRRGCIRSGVAACRRAKRVSWEAGEGDGGDGGDGRGRFGWRCCGRERCHASVSVSLLFASMCMA